MKTTQILAFLFIAALLSIYGNAIVAHAQTSTFSSDFGDRAEINSAGVNVFAYDVSQTMQNQANGGWISGNTYQVNWTIRIDYVNTDIINGNSYILFYLPQPLDNNSNVAKQILVNQTRLSLTQKTGTLSATFTPGNLTGYFFSLNLQFALYLNGALYMGHLGTDAAQNAQFSVEVSNSQDPSAVVAETPEFPFSSTALVLSAAAAASATLVSVTKKREQRCLALKN